MNIKSLSLIFTLTFGTLLFNACKSDKDDDVVTPTATCTDGIMNGTETGIDCGGTCTPCVSCSDGIQNGTETDIDCGGSCTACAAPSFTATIFDGTTTTPFVADTTSSLTYVDSSRGGGYTSYSIVARNSAASTLRFGLNVSANDLLDTVKTNVDYNVGNISGIITGMIFYQTNGSTPGTYGATGTGKIRFTKINHTAHTISGTFNFVGTFGTYSRTITAGVFTNLPLK